MYGIYANIYYQYTPNVSIYIPYMDPMGYSLQLFAIFLQAVRLNDSQQGQQQRGLPCTRTTNDASNLEIDALQETQTWRNMVWLVVEPSL